MISDRRDWELAAIRKQEEKDLIKNELMNLSPVQESATIAQLDPPIHLGEHEGQFSPGTMIDHVSNNISTGAHEESSYGNATNVTQHAFNPRQPQNNASQRSRPVAVERLPEDHGIPTSFVDVPHATTISALTTRRSEANESIPESSTSDHANARGLIMTSVAVDDVLSQHLYERQAAHARLMKIMMWRQRTWQETCARASNGQQHCLGHCTPPEQYSQSVSPFAAMVSAQVTKAQAPQATGLYLFGQDCYTENGGKRPPKTSQWAVCATRYESRAVVIPPFKEYFNVQSCFLADNYSKLRVTPYLDGEDAAKHEELQEALPPHYEIYIDEHGPRDLRMEQSRFYKDMIETMLKAMDVSWNHILYWLLAADQDLMQNKSTWQRSASLQEAFPERSQYNKEFFWRAAQTKKESATEKILFDRESELLRDLCRQLGELSPTKILVAAFLCEGILRRCAFNIWYLARESRIAQNHLKRTLKSKQNTNNDTYYQLLCAVCHQ